MYRREYLQATVALPFSRFDVTTPQPQSSDESVISQIISEFLRSLPESEDDREEILKNCANRFCKVKQRFKLQSAEQLSEAGKLAEKTLRRTKLALQILHENEIASNISQTTVEEAYATVSSVTKYIPLLGSFQNIFEKACAVTQDADDVELMEEFLYAIVAFGIEVGLFTLGVPYQMAWRGTRFVANRTLLRLIDYVGTKPVALAMSEVHWAIRGTIYNEAVESDEIEYVIDGFDSLKSWGKNKDIGNYTDFVISRGEISKYDFVSSSNEWLFDFDIPFEVEVDLPSLENLTSDLG